MICSCNFLLQIWSKSNDSQKFHFIVIHVLYKRNNDVFLSFRAANEAESGGNGVKGKINEAIGKSAGKSKETVEESAKAAAKVVGEAIHKTSQKVKESGFSAKDESDAEL